MEKWKILAKAEGRICPECGCPVSRSAWKEMHRYEGKVQPCYTCLYVHWMIPLKHAGGSVMRDNQDREGLDYIRGLEHYIQ